uniref:Protein bicaudal C n=1 Tax=Lygus hesperus TaxID=30085 RepID=A0A146M074_LYGHE
MATAMSEESRSETTSTSTADERHFLTKDERDEVARMLGIPEEDVVQERFPVSRRRMEQLMFGHSEDTAFEFFDGIMRETKTVIIWPTRLKMNARSRKDPFIKVRGLTRDIAAAKDRIIEGLDAEVKKVTLKIDVSYTDHSHIIGRGGNTIKGVMSSTGCHIHFPDCNRSNQHEKSNMVSIAGEVENVEIARAKVRELVPLVFSFDLPVMGTIFMPMEEHSSFITSLKDQFNVQVFFRTKQKLNSTLVLVKGSGQDYERVKEATEKLISHMKTNQSEQVQIYATIEISPHHHCIVRGKDNCNLNLIKSHTRTQITFPDLQDTNLPSIKRSNVCITGDSIQSVYNALQYVIGSLPVVFSFEIPESVADTSQLHDINDRFDVITSAKIRSKGNVYTFIIKGVERNMANIYEAYKALLHNNNDVRAVSVEVPASYLLPGALPFNSVNTSSTWSERSRSPSSYSASSPIASSPVSPGPQLPTSTTRIHHHHHHHPGHNHYGLHHSHSNPSFLGETGFVPIPPGYHLSQRNQPYSLWTNPLQILPSQHDRELGRLSLSIPSIPGNSSVSSNVSSTAPSPLPSPRTLSPTNSNPPSYGDNCLHFGKCNGSSTRHSSRESPVPSPRTLSPTNSNTPSYGDSGFYFAKPSVPVAMSRPADLVSSVSDHLRKSVAQLKKQRPKPSELRIPTPTWSGCGFSQSGPTSTLRELKMAHGSDDGEEWRTITSGASSKSSDSLALSNILEAVGGSVVEAVSTVPNIGDLQTLLASIGLEKYYTNFHRHEATELEIFTSLNESDLVGIGINALGARKKLLMLIAELKLRFQDFRATPGAERKRLPKEIWWPEPN